MKFVLIVVMSAFGGSGLNTWEQPALAMATFDDKQSCENAANVAQHLHRDTGLRFVRVSTACVPISTQHK